MKKLLVFLLLLGGCFSWLAAGELVVAQRGKASRYQIVYPDPVGSKTFDRYMKHFAGLIAKCFWRATGVSLKVASEKEANPALPAIYFGNTRALKKAGLSAENLQLWEHHIVVRGQNIYIYGKDVLSNPRSPWPNSPTAFIWGSLKGGTTFLEKFVHTRFVAPYEQGMVTLTSTKVAIPDNLNYRKVPAFTYCVSRWQELIYDVANNAFYAPWYGTYGGHSHDKAIPPLKYRDKKPEYFSLYKGKRTRPSNSCPQYCLSNPQVQKMIYQNLLDHADQGYKMVQLGQSDGFRGCECEKCQKLFGVKDWGEKLWILHRNMAQRFAKDRPGKLLCIMAYGPTLRPPRTFKEFPDNVMIELSPFMPDFIEDWKKIKVKHGFTTYLYNWGWYQHEGFAPKCSFNLLERQVRQFTQAQVHGIYRCGFGEMWGLEGASYYVWSNLLADSRQDYRQLLQEYCQYAFDQGAADMEKFYLLLSDRLDLDYNGKNKRSRVVIVDNEGKNQRLIWDDPELFDGDIPIMLGNYRLLLARYPEAVCQQLEKYLTQAEAKCRTTIAKHLLKLARLEFDYLKTSAKSAAMYQKFWYNKSAQNFQNMVKCLQLRNQVIARVRAAQRNRQLYQPRTRVFGGASLEAIQCGGRLLGPLYKPFTWDIDWLLKNNIQPAGRVIRTSGAPQMLVGDNMLVSDNYAKKCPTTIQCRWDAKNLYVIFRLSNIKEKELQDHRISVFLDNGKKRLMLAGRCRNDSFAVYERSITNRANNGHGSQYKRNGSAQRCQCPAPGIKETCSVMMSIPWSLFGEVPKKGDQWKFNAKHNYKWNGVIWEYNIYQKNWRNISDETGTIVFD